MDQTFFPPEIISNILPRLPAKTVVRCKCVCKLWLELIETSEFVKDHLSKSIPGLIVYDDDAFKLFEYVDELELEHHDLHYNLVVEFSKTIFTRTFLERTIYIQGSVNGLLLLRCLYPTGLYVCNPITREYIELPCEEEDHYGLSVNYGFGVSATNSLYKVIMILQECEPAGYTYSEFKKVIQSECWVYTLGKRKWKEIMPCPVYDYVYGTLTNVFFRGNLHWLVEDLNHDALIYSLDLETEVISTFPPHPVPGRPSRRMAPFVFENCLCICENIDDEIDTIWMMKEYGNEKSWTKTFVFTTDSDISGYIYPLKLFKDGDILMQWGYGFLFYYSKKTNTVQKLDLYELRQRSIISARMHVSSFLSIGSLAMEDVRKF